MEAELVKENDKIVLSGDLSMLFDMKILESFS